VAPAGADLEPFGLAEPELVIRTRGADAVVAVGAENPAADGRYVRVGGGPVQMAKAYLVSGLLQDPRDLRSKDVLPSFPWNRLRSVSVEAPGAPALKLVKAAGAWRLAKPAEAAADPDAAEGLAEKLRWAKAASFLDETAETAAPKFARGVTVTLEAEGDARTSAVRLAEVGQEVWVAADDRKALFTLPRDVLDAFRVKPGALERTKPILTKAWSAEALELTAPARNDQKTREVAYERKEGAWRRGGQIVKGEEGGRLQDLLRTLEETGASRVLRAPAPPSAYGLDAPRFTLVLSDSQQGRQTLAVGEKGGVVSARAGDSGPVYEMPGEYLARIEALEKAGAKAAGNQAPEKKP
jgi:hypothetical protein